MQNSKRRIAGGSTLSIKPQAAPEPEVTKPAETPVFDPERLAVQTYSAEGGMGFIQGKNIFGSSGRFIREAPEAQWYTTTPEQEENNRKARARNRMIFGKRAGPAQNQPALPLKLIQAARENSIAAAAEALAE